MTPETRELIRRIVRGSTADPLLSDLLISNQPHPGRHISKARGHEGYKIVAQRDFEWGDDYRHLNLPGSAGTGMQQLIVDVRQKKRRATVNVLVCMDGSTDFTSRPPTTKRMIAGYVIADLLATRAPFDFGLTLYSSTGLLRPLMLPVSAYTALQPALTMLFEAPTKNSNQTGGGLSEALQVLHPESLLLVCSDFADQLGTGQAAQADRDALRRAGLRHTLRCIQLTDPLESALPESGVITLQDMTSGELVSPLIFNQDRLAYAENARRRQSALDQLFKDSRARAGIFSTDGNQKAWSRQLRSLLRTT